MNKTFRLADADLKVYEHLKKFNGFSTDIEFFRFVLQQAYQNQFGEEERSQQLLELQKINARLDQIDKQQKKLEAALEDIDQVLKINHATINENQEKNDAIFTKLFKYCNQILLQIIFTNKGNTLDDKGGLFAKTREKIIHTFEKLRPY